MLVVDPPRMVDPLPMVDPIPMVDPTPICHLHYVLSHCLRRRSIELFPLVWFQTSLLLLTPQSEARSAIDVASGDTHVAVSNYDPATSNATTGNTINNVNVINVAGTWLFFIAFSLLPVSFSIPTHVNRTQR